MSRAESRGILGRWPDAASRIAAGEAACPFLRPFPGPRAVVGPVRASSRPCRLGIDVLLIGSILWLGSVDAGGAELRFRSPFDPFGPPALSGAVAPALGDLDGDGDADALVADESGRLLLFENRGGAGRDSFGEPAVDPFGLGVVGSALRPALVDFDGNGLLDLFIGEAGGSVLFFRNVGRRRAPSFADPPEANPFGLAPVGSEAAPAFGDLDGDGDVDAVVGDSRWNVWYYENTAGARRDPSFAAPVRLLGPGLGTNAQRPALADVDGDGRIDLLVGSDKGGVSFLRNLGTDASGRPTFAAPTKNPFGLSVPGFPYYRLADPPIASFPALADLDGDGDVDALIGIGEFYPPPSPPRLGYAIPFVNVGTATAPRFVSGTVNPFGLRGVATAAYPALGDLDGDGDLDAVLGQRSGDVLFAENVGNPSAPSFSAYSPLPGGGNEVWTAPAVADLDLDGDLDLLVGARFHGSSSVHVFLAEGTGAPPDLTFWGTPWRSSGGLQGDRGSNYPAPVDIDADGDVDVWLGRALQDGLFLRESDLSATGSFDPNAWPLVGPEPYGLNSGSDAALAFGDLDGDGDFDAVAGSRDGGLAFFENIGAPTAPEFAAGVSDAFADAPLAFWTRPTLGDLDGDGDFDLLVGTVTGSTYFFENVAPRVTCPAAPAPDCRTGFRRGRLEVNERRPGRETLLARLLRGPGLGTADFGDPTVAGGTAYAVCIYDDAGALVRELIVDRAGEECGRAPCWSTRPAGYAYSDVEGRADGVTNVTLKTGGARTTRLSFDGANSAARDRLSLPVGTAAALQATTSVEVQVHGSDLPRCFARTFSSREIRRQAADYFLARASVGRARRGGPGG